MTDETTVNAVTGDAADLAEALLAALKAPTSHANGTPLVQGDLRDVMIDGHFDLVALARHLREALRCNLLDVSNQTDWRRILYVYINHVGAAEGATFLDDLTTPHRGCLGHLTEKELEALYQVEAESYGAKLPEKPLPKRDAA